MLTDQQDQNLTNAQKRSLKRRQDKDHPMVVNINDGRRMPNVPMLREHRDYRVYMGPPNASDADALKWVRGDLKRGTPQVTYTSPTDAFDVGKATKDDLIVFAMEEFALALEPTMHIATMRSKVLEASNKVAEAATKKAFTEDLT